MGAGGRQPEAWGVGGEQLGTGGGSRKGRWSEGSWRQTGKEEPGGTGEGGGERRGGGKPARRWVDRGERQGEGPNTGRTGGKAAGSRGRDQRDSMADTVGGGDDAPSTGETERGENWTEGGGRGGG